MSYTQTVASWNAKLRPIARDYALSVAFWLPLSLLVGWQMYLAARDVGRPVALADMLLIYAARYLAVAILTPPICYCVNRWPIPAAVPRRTWIYLLGYIPFTVAFAVLRWIILPPWFFPTRSWEPRTLRTLFQLTYDSFADVFLLYLGVVVAAHAYTYLIRDRIQEMERLKLRESLAHSELQALRAQLHPHFLFNTLQGISTLIDTDPVTAQNMLHALASLLRTALKHGSTDLITFREELDFVRAYLDLEHMRLGKRLEVRWQIAPEAYVAQIPQLLLQPLIENAIVHGIANAREGGWIEVNAKVQEEKLHVQIRNSVAGVSQPGLRVGLANTRARLKYLYSEDAHLEFELRADAGLAVALLGLPAFTTVPQEQSAELPQLSKPLCES